MIEYESKILQIKKENEEKLRLQNEKLQQQKRQMEKHRQEQLEKRR